MLPEHSIVGSVCKTSPENFEQVLAEIESLQRSANPLIGTEATNYIKEKGKMASSQRPDDLSKDVVQRRNRELEQKAKEMSGRIDNSPYSWGIFAQVGKHFRIKSYAILHRFCIDGALKLWISSGLCLSSTKTSKMLSTSDNCVETFSRGRSGRAI